MGLKRGAWKPSLGGCARPTKQALSTVPRLLARAVRGQSAQFASNFRAEALRFEAHGRGTAGSNGEEGAFADVQRMQRCSVLELALRFPLLHRSSARPTHPTYATLLATHATLPTYIATVRGAAAPCVSHGKVHHSGMTPSDPQQDYFLSPSRLAQSRRGPGSSTLCVCCRPDTIRLCGVGRGRLSCSESSAGSLTSPRACARTLRDNASVSERQGPWVAVALCCCASTCLPRLSRECARRTRIPKHFLMMQHGQGPSSCRNAIACNNHGDNFSFFPHKVGEWERETRRIQTWSYGSAFPGSGNVGSTT